MIPSMILALWKLYMDVTRVYKSFELAVLLRKRHSGEKTWH